MNDKVNGISNEEQETEEMETPLNLERLRLLWTKKNQSFITDFLHYLVGHQGNRYWICLIML